MEITKMWRGAYGQIVSATYEDGVNLHCDKVIKIFATVLPETFAEFDKKMRGDALNLDLYGYDEDQGVAVIQIRHAFRMYKNGFMNVHKDYVLVGQNEETKEFFRHPVSGHAIHAAIRKDPTHLEAAVRGAQRWMWEVSDAQLAKGIRQGDILMVPSDRKPPKAIPLDEKSVVVAGTHEINAAEFCKDTKGNIWAFAPTMRHTKGQHSIAHGQGEFWHAIKVGRESQAWEWGVRLGD